MYSQGHRDTEWYSRFFRIAISHESLANMYQVNFSMMQHHKYSLSELENMIPWEREVYTSMLAQWLKEEEEKMKQQQV